MVLYCHADGRRNRHPDTPRWLQSLKQHGPKQYGTSRANFHANVWWWSMPHSAPCCESLGPSSTDETLERRSRHAARHNTCYSSCRVRIPYLIVRTDGLCATLCQQLLECCVILVLMINRCKSQLCTAKMSRHFLHVRKCQNFLDRCSSLQFLIHWRGHLHRSARGQSPSSGLRCHILTSVSRL